HRKKKNQHSPEDPCIQNGIHGLPPFVSGRWCKTEANSDPAETIGPARRNVASQATSQGGVRTGGPRPRLWSAGSGQVYGEFAAQRREIPRHFAKRSRCS